MNNLIEDLSPIQSGRELDALVAEHVMGWQKIGDMLGPPQGDKRASWATQWNVDAGLPDYLPKYSTDYADMGEMIEKLLQRYDFINLNYDCGYWFCTIKTIRRSKWVTLADTIGKPTIMEAACYAALEAVGYVFRRDDG